MAWTTCECGCGWEGVDDVTQFCIEEACFERLEWADRNERLSRLQNEVGEQVEESLHSQLGARHQSLMQGVQP